MITRSMFGRMLALLLAIALALPSTAWADDAAAAAAEYYNQATTAYQQGDYKKAADLLDLAFGANPDLVYKYNRILALQALGDYDTALAELNTMYGPMKADGQNRFDDIDQIKAQLEAQIKAQQANDTPPDDNPPPDDTPPIAPPPEKSGPSILGITLLGGGALVLGTGVLFSTGVLLPDAVKRCSLDDPADCSDYASGYVDTPLSVIKSDSDNVKTTHQIAAVSLISAGAILAGVGVVVLVLHGQKKAAPETAGLDSLRFSPYVSHDGAGAALQLRF